MFICVTPSYVTVCDPAIIVASVCDSSSLVAL